MADDSGPLTQRNVCATVFTFLMVSPNTPETPGGASSASGVPRSIHDVVIRLAGNSQDGIQAVGGFLARLAGRSDQDIMTYMTIPSTISGGPSIFQVRMGTGDILSAGDRADMLVAFYQHSYDAHIGSLRPGGVLVYDSDHVKPTEEDHRFTNVAIPITTGTVEAVGGTSKDKGKNIYTLGLIARIFDLDVQKLAALIKERFGGKNEDIVRNAMLAFDAGYAWPQNNLRDLFYRFEAIDRATTASTTGRAQITLDGNTAIERDLRAAGRRDRAVDSFEAVEEIAEIVLRPRVAGVEREHRVADDVFVLAAKALLDERGELRNIEVEDPCDDAEHVDILALVFRRAADGFDGARRDRDGNLREAVVLGVGGDVVGVVEEHATGAQRTDMRVVAVLIKRHEHVRAVAGREDVAGAHAHLENRRTARDRGRDRHVGHDVRIAAAGEAGEEAADRLDAGLGIAGESNDDVLN